jgi:cell division protein FtsN
MARACVGTQAPAAALAAPAAKSTPPPAAPPAAPPAVPSAKPSGTQYSVQLAAYNTQREADAAVKRFATRGVEARVDGSEKPFRIRTGRFAAQADAVALLAKLKRQGFAGFVAEITP